VFRNMVRDLIAELVGAAISKAVQALLVVTIPKILAEVALMVAEWAAKIVQVMRRLSDAITALGGKFPALAEICGRISRSMDGWTTDLAFESVFTNSSKLYAADSHISDSEGALGGFKHAYKTLSEGEAVVHGTKAQIAADALREGLKLNSIQNGSTTAGSLHQDEPGRPQIDLPL
jgi:hypothetical protein